MTTTEDSDDSVSALACSIRAVKEYTNPNPAPRKMPEQVFAELQQKLDADALREHYIAIEQRLQTERAQVDRVFATLRGEASKQRKRADSAEMKLKAYKALNRFVTPVVFALFIIGLARHGL